MPAVTAPSHHRLDALDGHDIELLCWLPSAPPLAVVQIAHGMGEHAMRYGRLAQALVAAGCAVYANHHRGHGPGAKAAGTLGDFGRGGFAAVVADMARVSEHARAVNTGAPLLLLGHSMGSFAAQLYLLEHHRLLSGLALSGTAETGLRFANRDPNRKLQDMNTSVEQPRTPFDWLSRDAREVDAYIADPLCGFTITPTSRQSMFEACDRLSAPDAFAAKHSNASDLADALVRLYRDNASTLTPDPIYSAFHDSHPPPAERIARLRSTFIDGDRSPVSAQ